MWSLVVAEEQKWLVLGAGFDEIDAEITYDIGGTSSTVTVAMVDTYY